MIDHVSIPVRSLDRSVEFYDQALATIGWRRVVERPGNVGYAPAAKLPPSFWLVASRQEAAQPGPGLHLSFGAQGEAAVHAFFNQAVAAGARSAGEPGYRPEYAKNYFSCFVIDPDGFKIEATYRS